MPYLEAGILFLYFRFFDMYLQTSSRSLSESSIRYTASAYLSNETIETHYNDVKAPSIKASPSRMPIPVDPRESGEVKVAALAPVALGLLLTRLVKLGDQ
jgi:hypothetical protein